MRPTVPSAFKLNFRVSGLSQPNRSSPPSSGAIGPCSLIYSLSVDVQTDDCPDVGFGIVVFKEPGDRLLQG